MQRALLKSAEDIENSFKSLDEASQKVLPSKDAAKDTKIRITCRKGRVKARSLVVSTKVLSPYVKNAESVEQMNSHMKAFSVDVIGLRDLSEVSFSKSLFKLFLTINALIEIPIW